MHWIILLLVLGIIMVCLEIFIPGAIVGTLGGIALVASVVLAFKQQGPTFGMWWFLGTIGLTALGIYLAIKLFPRSRAGKKIILDSSESGFSSRGQDLADLLGKEGKALSALRPAGLVEIEGRRIDVVTGGEFLPDGTTVMVTAVEGSRVVVRAK